MTQGFYEQLGIGPGTPVADIRAAYTRVVSQLSKRRRAVTEAGGDPAPLDLARQQADEAWRVLRDPARRRRYDAMRAVEQENVADGAELWRRTAGALIHPAAASAAELLRVISTLKIGALPPAPRPDAVRAVSPSPMPTNPGGAPLRTETTAAPGRSANPTVVPTGTASMPGVLPAPVQVPRVAEPGSHVSDMRGVPPVRGVANDAPLREPPSSAPSTPSVASSPGRPGTESMRSAPSVSGLFPPSPPRHRGPAIDDLAQLIDRFGYSGALLRAVRESRGLSAQDVSDATRISMRYLEAIEADQHDALPSPTFVRGYVREMARVLGLDEESTVAGYMRRFAR